MLEAFHFGLEWYHWLVGVVNVIFMAYCEGYKGFQQAFSPRVAARARYLEERPHWLRTLLAPLFVMGFFHATKRRLIVTYSLTIGIVILILLFRQLPQPWHGVLDAGVVIGLAWGSIATLACWLKVAGGGPVPWSAETPDERVAPTEEVVSDNA